MSFKARVISATPMISLIIFLTVGFTTGRWHPTWCVFFLIPVMPIILSDHLWKSFYPLVCVVLYVFIGLMWNKWHPGWIIFLTIPVYFTLVGDAFSKKKKQNKAKIVD